MKFDIIKTKSKTCKKIILLWTIFILSAILLYTWNQDEPRFTLQLISNFTLPPAMRLEDLNETNLQKPTQHQIQINRLLHLRKKCSYYDVYNSQKITMSSPGGHLRKMDGPKFYKKTSTMKPTKPKLDQTIYNMQYQVDQKYNLIYCNIHKVGSTAWNSLFAILQNHTELIRQKNVHKMRQIMTKNKYHILKIIHSNKMFKFLMVRHPFTRLLSAYNDKLNTTKHSWARKKHLPRIIILNRPNIEMSSKEIEESDIIPTFKEFLYYLSKIDIYEFDAHWMPYWKLCSPCAIDYQAIGHEETKETDIPYILRQTGLLKEASLIMESNSNGGKLNTKKFEKEIYSKIDTELLEKIYKKYQIDFFLFNFSIEDFFLEIYPNKNISFKNNLKLN